MKRQKAPKLLAEYLKSALRVRGQKARLAREAGVSPVTVTDWSSGKYSPRLDQLDAIAAALGVSAADLFSVTSSVAPPQLQSGHIVSQGDTHDGAETRLLRARLAVLDTENAALRRAVDALASEFKTLASVQPRQVAGTAPRSRRRR